MSFASSRGHSYITIENAREVSGYRSNYAPTSWQERRVFRMWSASILWGKKLGPIISIPLNGHMQMQTKSTKDQKLRIKPDDLVATEKIEE